MNTQLLEQARRLSVEERIELVEAIWDSIATSNAAPPPTDAQKAELDRRIADHEAHPDDVVPWNEIKADALARMRR
jgi:putative addiction module component (TIGR02574 family)